VESEITIERTPLEVHDHLAHAERLPEYVTEFAWVKQEGGEEPEQGTVYSYKMARGHAEGTFEWSEFERARLAWKGPPASAGAIGSMAPSGWWELTERNGATHVKLVMTPRPGGLMKLLAPMMAGSMRKGNDRALQRLKAQLER
jgi:Polyketide cyclase / dehydrase and lipid transport